MRNLIAVLLLGAATTAITFAQTQNSPVSGPFSITISTPKTEVKAGTAVWVRATLTNTSQREINASVVRSRGVDLSYRYDVRELNGNLVETVDKKGMGKHIQSVLVRSLKPNETSEEDTLVSRVYNMSRPGQYVIQLSRSVSDNPKDGAVKSNTINVTVIP